MAIPTELSPRVSVVLCTHNPRLHHLQATLEGLRQQDLPLTEWELLVVDNASTVPVAASIDLGWHPQARLLTEPTLGLANARVCGYRASRGRLIVHSDDDNVLAPDYLRTAWALAQQHAHLGAFGGEVIPQFDQPPRTALERSFGGERRVAHDRWSHQLDDPETMPFGAGMCLRREVIEAYLQQITADPRRLILGRTGQRFHTGEDIDLNHVAVRTGYRTGLYRRLRLVHLIPPERMTAEHVIAYRAGNAYSMVILWFLHTGEVRIPHATFLGRWRNVARSWIRRSPHERRLERALHRARKDAVRDLRTWGWLS